MRLRLLVSTAALIGLTACHRRPAHGELTIAAATSLREVMPELIRVYQTKHRGAHVSATYGASGDLKRQVDLGAPIDAVLFASGEPVDALVLEGKVDKESRRVIATNVMVLAGPRGAPPLTFATLGKLPPKEKLAVGDPRTVPAGQYAKEYLTSLGEWSSLENRLVTGTNVAAVLVYARHGEAAAAIAYKTELRGVGDLVILDEARGPTAPRPEVVAGKVTGGAADANEFLQFVVSPEGEAVLASFGFGAP